MTIGGRSTTAKFYREGPNFSREYTPAFLKILCNKDFVLCRILSLLDTGIVCWLHLMTHSPSNSAFEDPSLILSSIKGVTAMTTCWDSHKAEDYRGNTHQTGTMYRPWPFLSISIPKFGSQNGLYSTENRHPLSCPRLQNN